MSNYYTMQDSKVELMQGLIENGWKVYGYKADESDSMTDYWSPARWEGIATKNGYVLVVDQLNNRLSEYEVKEYNYSNVKNNSDKIEKLYATMNDVASSDNEKEVCQRKIDQLEKENKPSYKVIEVYPTFSFGNPGRCNWHIEKDGVIIAKGTGIGSIYAGYNNTTETNKNVQKFIDKFEKAIVSNTEMVAVEKEVVKKVLKFVESDNKKLIENETVIMLNSSFSGGFHKGAKVIFKESYVYGEKTRYKFIRIGKRNQELKHKAENILIFTFENFNKYVNEGSLIIGSIQEVEEITIKTVYVKKERTEKEVTKQTEQVTEITTNNVIETVSSNKINDEITENNSNNNNTGNSIGVDIIYKLNDEKNGVEIYFSKKPSEEIRNELKVNKFRWSKYNKCWYAKQNDNTISLAKKLSNESKNDYNSSASETLDNYKKLHEEINMNDLDNYIINDSLSKAENNANWIFRTKELDHNKIVHDLFFDMNKEATEAISKIDNEYYIYKIKMLLQSTKKKYYNAYTSWLSAKINCPSWAVTGRAGRSQSKYEKGMARIEKWEREKWAIVDNFNNKLEYYQYKEVKDKENKLQQEVNKAMKNVDVNSIQFITKRINMEDTKYELHKQLQCYVAGDYFICKVRGSFSIFNLTTKEEIHSMKSKDKLTDAKKYVAYLINKDQSNTTTTEENNKINDEIETLKDENNAIQSAIEEVEEQTEMTALYDQDGKIEVNHIVINWSESAYLKDNSKYFTWAELDKAIYKASCNAPKNGAYDKTSYTVTWSDGTTYTGRIDLQYKDSYKTNIIPNAIRDYLTFMNGTNKPAHMTQQEYNLHMEQDSEKLKQIERYLNDLSYSDSEPVTPPEKPTNETNSNVINLFDHKRNKEQTETKEAVKTLVNASNSVIDFTNIRVQKEEKKETQKQLDAFFNDIYPLMTRNDIETLLSMRNATDEEIAHELARITTRIELQKKLKKQ